MHGEVVLRIKWNSTNVIPSTLSDKSYNILKCPRELWTPPLSYPLYDYLGLPVATKLLATYLHACKLPSPTYCYYLIYDLPL